MNEVREIASLRPHPGAGAVPRPDSGDRKALRSSLAEDGQQDPVDVTPDGAILDGLTRWELLRRLAQPMTLWEGRA